jgi:hypothetical protein
MKASEVLHGLADLLAGLEGQQTQSEPNRAELVQVEVPNDDHSEAGVFVPPLQAKLEILKKSVGMDNVYGGEGDELSDVKKLAGLSPTQQEAADDEPLEI